MTNMEQIAGVHGTSRSRAANIVSEGFRSGLGMCGYAVYFFEYTRQGMERAKGYYRLAFERLGQYEQDDRDEAALILAQIFAEKQCIIDLDDPVLRDLLQSAWDANRDRLHRDDHQAKNLFYDALLRRFETILQREFKVCWSTLPMNKKYIGVKKSRVLFVRSMECIRSVELLEDEYGCE